MLLVERRGGVALWLMFNQVCSSVANHEAVFFFFLEKVVQLWYLHRLLFSVSNGLTIHSWELHQVNPLPSRCMPPFTIRPALSAYKYQQPCHILRPKWWCYWIPLKSLKDVVLSCFILWKMHLSADKWKMGPHKTPKLELCVLFRWNRYSPLMLLVQSLNLSFGRHFRLLMHLCNKSYGKSYWIKLSGYTGYIFIKPSCSADRLVEKEFPVLLWTVATASVCYALAALLNWVVTSKKNRSHSKSSMLITILSHYFAIVEFIRKA